MLILSIVALLFSTPASEAGLQRELGKTLFKQGRVDEAIARFQAAVQLNPQDAAAWRSLADATRKQQRFEQSADAYQHYLALSPDDADGWFGLAESLRLAEKPQDAAKAYETYLAKETRDAPEKAQAQKRVEELKNARPDPVKKGDVAFAAKDYRSALFAYQDATVADPKNVEALVKAGETYARMGHDVEAIAQWNKALQLDPKNAQAREGIAAANERAAALAPKPAPVVQREDEPAARAHYTKAVGLLKERSYDAAAAELDKALAAKPGFAVALVARGSARIGQGRYQEAVADYTAAQKADPSLASPLFGLAEAFRGMGQNEKAADLYRQFAASKAEDADPGLKDYALQNAQALTPAK